MDFDSLEALVAFADGGNNFSAAAERIHLSQPAVHLRIRNLSEAIGAALYRREGRHLVLTDAGRGVLAFARDLLARREKLQATLRGEARPEPVTLCAGEGAWLYLLPRLLAKHERAIAPMRALVRDADSTLEAVATAMADVGVLPIARVPADMESVEVARVGAALVVRREHPLAKKRRLQLAALDGERLVVPPAGQPHRRAIEQALEAAGVTWEVAAEAPGWPLQLRLVALGLGAAIVNDFCELPAGVVKIALPSLPAIGYRAVRRRSGLRTVAGERLWSALKAGSVNR